MNETENHELGTVDSDVDHHRVLPTRRTQGVLTQVLKYSSAQLFVWVIVQNSRGSYTYSKITRCNYRPPRHDDKVQGW